MKVSAINPVYNSQVQAKRFEKPIETTAKPSPNLPQGMTMISFKSGNPKHIAHIVAEEPLFGFAGGGVGTVSHDYNFLDKDYEKITKLIPLYNQEVVYEKDIDKKGELKGTKPQSVEIRKIPDNLPEGHPFKGQEGTAFVTNVQIDKSTNLTELLKDKQKQIFLLDEVKSGSMDWGFEKNVPIKMFKARKDANLINAMNNKKMPQALQDKLEFVFTYVDSTSSMPKPYADGKSYATATGSELEKRFASGWKGQEYAKFDKALIELMPGLKEKYNIDPAYILCSDAHTMFAMHYAAQKNAAGDSYWLDKFLGGVGHNMQPGYDGAMGARQAIVGLGATKEQLETLINSKEYIEAIKMGEEEKFLKETVLKNFTKDKNYMNAFSVPVHYASVGYSPMFTTVSEGYQQALINNQLLSPMYKDLNELAKQGRFKGITNPLMDPSVSPFKESIFQVGYQQDTKIKLADGTETIVKKFLPFDEKNCDLKHVRETKRLNKINLLERFDKKFIGSQYINKEGKADKPNSGRMHILAGRNDRKASIFGEISKEYLDKLKAGKDIKMVTSWGRMDFQKGMETVLDSFEKFAQKDPDSILILGGPTENDSAKALLERMKEKIRKPELKGRVIIMQGFTPGKDFAMAADVALLPSRFAPCELTDLEAKKCLCTPIVPNVQGMGQKNFDPSIAKEADRMDAYKGKHEYYMTEETAYKAANENAKKAFDETKKSIIDTLEKEYKGQVNEKIPEELLKKSLEGDEKYKKALAALRDSVISDEMAECLERALITDRNSTVAENILKNQIKMDTTWHGNGWLSLEGKSAGELYRELHFNNKGQNISKDKLIELDFSGLTPMESTNNGNGKVEGTESWIKRNWNKLGKKGKIAVGVGAGLIAIGGAAYAINKNKAQKTVEEEDKHLSTVG